MDRGGVKIHWILHLRTEVLLVYKIHNPSINKYSITIKWPQRDTFYIELYAHLKLFTPNYFCKSGVKYIYTELFSLLCVLFQYFSKWKHDGGICVDNYLLCVCIFAFTWGAGEARFIRVRKLYFHNSIRKEMFYLMTHSTHFIYGYMASITALVPMSTIINRRFINNS